MMRRIAFRLLVLLCLSCAAIAPNSTAQRMGSIPRTKTNEQINLLLAATAGQWRGEIEAFDTQTGHWYVDTPVTITKAFDIQTSTMTTTSVFQVGPLEDRREISTVIQTRFDPVSGIEEYVFKPWRGATETKRRALRLAQATGSSTSWSIIADYNEPSRSATFRWRETTTRSGQTMTVLLEFNTGLSPKSQFRPNLRTRVTLQ
jgi:hypothetical protein